MGVLDFFKFYDLKTFFSLDVKENFKSPTIAHCKLSRLNQWEASVFWKNFSCKDSFFHQNDLHERGKKFLKASICVQKPLQNPHYYSSQFFLPSLYCFLVCFSGLIALSKLLWQGCFSETKRLRKGSDRNNWMQNRCSKKGWSWMRECKPFKAKSLGNNEAATTLNLWLLEWETRYKQCRSCGHRCKQFALNKTTLLERL